MKKLARHLLCEAAVVAARSGRRPGVRPSVSASMLGFFETASGLGFAARSLRDAMGGRDFECWSLSALAHTPSPPDLAGHCPSFSPQYNGASLALHCYNPDVFVTMIRRFGLRFLRANTANVAFVIWESGKLPALWRRALRAYDLVCAYSNFSASAVAAALGRPVPVVPIGLAEKPPRRISPENGIFTFLLIFDNASDFHRKNPLATVRALRSARDRAGYGERFRLKIKCHSNTPREVLALLRSECGPMPTEIVAETLDNSQLEALWAECDCYISLHRSEGYGLPVAEALARGIPVVTTKQGGILDFTADEGAFLVTGDAAARNSAGSLYDDWTGWVEPDHGEATRFIGEVLQNYDAAVKRASFGRKYLMSRISHDAVRSQFVAGIQPLLEEKKISFRLP